jgi:tripartite-type tricarboxylate transporter receptor subunit TctC
MIESGIPGFVVTQWHGVLSAARTPAAVVERLHREIVKTVAQPDVIARLANDGAEPIASSPAQFTAFVKAEFAKYSAVIKQTGIQPE